MYNNKRDCDNIRTFWALLIEMKYNILLLKYL